MKYIHKIQAAAVLMLLPILGVCQNNTATNDTYFSNALFNTLLGIILLLLIIIVAFSNVVKNVADSDYFDKKIKNENGGGISGKALTMFFVLAGVLSLQAETNTKDTVGGIDTFTFYFMLTIIFVELLVLGLLIYQFKFMIRTKMPKVAEAAQREDTLMKSLTDAVPVEEEASIMLDHDYDGIKELDNNLPPWWKYGFYLTIVFALVYLYMYHVDGSADLQTVEYEKEMAKAKTEIEEYMKTAANKVDENTVTYLAEAKDQAAGKDAYLASCAACHGRAGEGGVGPNLTDAYWLHGGSIKDVFKSIKYGWPEKGMKSWKEDLSPMQIAQVTSYLISLKGSNPANGKAPQGDLYTEGTEAPAMSDSTAVKADSSAVIVPPDTLGNKK